MEHAVVSKLHSGTSIRSVGHVRPKTGVCSSNTSHQYLFISTVNLTSEEYQKILDVAPPDHHSDEFVSFLRTNNTVILETPEWLVVKNIKYHDEEKPWYTAFDLNPEYTLEYKLQLLQWEFPEYKMIIHPVIVRTVKRFHVHLIRVDKEYTICV